MVILLRSSFTRAVAGEVLRSLANKIVKKLSTFHYLFSTSFSKELQQRVEQACAGDCSRPVLMMDLVFLTNQ